ncbi:glutaredoxin domain-containing protein [Neptunomonas sp. XY-337]|uniref:glutaredoxin domain-containing protein n=1 Tax=Neptunomonas sp. XY-337 TaxID=2561897 RepID=UPI0010AA0F5C|nr:glutaredoxin domain-containing protein [Neptunomonas sp. XY-337]
MAVIRWILGKIILLIDFITTPKGIKRSAEAQQAVDAATQDLALYQFQACPFCVKVRRQMKRLSLNIALRDAKKDTQYREELLQQGGKVKVPCLKITDADGSVRWLYESNDINAYLTERFGQTEA